MHVTKQALIKPSANIYFRPSWKFEVISSSAHFPTLAHFCFSILWYVAYTHTLHKYLCVCVFIVLESCFLLFLIWASLYFQGTCFFRFSWFVEYQLILYCWLLIWVLSFDGLCLFLLFLLLLWWDGVWVGEKDWIFIFGPAYMCVESIVND